MELTLILEDAPPGTARTRFDTPGRAFTIGRDAACDWHLPDPTRLVSSVHCAVEIEDGTYVLHDRSRNGTRLGTHALRGGSAPLGPGASLVIGPYRIGVREAAPVNRSPAPSPVPPPADDVVHRFERAAGLPLDALAGRSGATLIEDAARALGAAAEVLWALRAARDDPDGEPSDAGRAAILAELLGPHAETSAPARVEAVALDLLDGERAMRAATEIALFQLLNELSPPTIEAAARSDARRWRLFRERWEAMATGTENGMLDAFRAARDAAYRERMGEQTGGQTGDGDDGLGD